jgi:hypothetical protein
VFTARYALSPYMKQIRFVFKGLKELPNSVTCNLRQWLLAPRPTLQLEDHILSVATDCLFNTFAISLSESRTTPSSNATATLHVWQHFLRYYCYDYYKITQCRRVGASPVLYFETFPGSNIGPVTSHVLTQSFQANDEPVQRSNDLHLSHQLQIV